MHVVNVEAFQRADGRIAVFQGDRFLGHLATDGAAAAPDPVPAAPRGRRGPARRSRGDVHAAPAEVSPIKKGGRRRSYTPAQETRVVKLLTKGKSVNAVAEATGLSWHTVNTIRKQHEAELADEGAAAGDDDTEDDSSARANPARSPPRRGDLKRLTLSQRPLPERDDDEDRPMRFSDSGRVRTEGLDLEAIDRVVDEAVRGGRAPEDPARRRAMELWDEGCRDLDAIAEECQVALSSVHYWHAKDDWECRRGRQVLKTA